MRTGWTEFEALPWPSCPLSPFPQQYTAPSTVSAQLCCWPTATSITFGKPATATGIFEQTMVYDELPLQESDVVDPSSKSVFDPQQYTSPVVVTAQVWNPPAAI